MPDPSMEYTVRPSPRFWYGVPHGYIQLDLDPSLDSVEELVAQVRGLDGEARTRAEMVVQFYAGIVTLLNGQQAQGCAIGLLPDGDGDFTSSVLTVSTVTFPGISPRLVLADLMGATSGKMQEGLRPMELPCGPGFLMERTRSAPIPGRADNEAGGPSDGRVWQGTVAVPVSGSHSIVMVQLVTAARDLADNYRDILRGVAYTLTFNDPNADQGIADERHTGSDDTTSPFG